MLMNDLPEARTRTYPKERGATLIEMVLYLAIASGLLVGVGATALAVMDIKAKARAMGAVLGSAEFAFGELARAFGVPGSLALPLPGATSSSVVFVPNATAVAETYRIIDGRLVRERDGNMEPLTGADTNVDDIAFVAMGGMSTSTGVRVRMTISARGSGLSRAHHYQESFSTAYMFGDAR